MTETMEDLPPIDEEEIPLDKPQSDKSIIRALMRKYDFSQADIAKEINVAQSAISEVLNDHRRFNRKQLEVISRRFQLDPRIFFRRD